MMKRNYSVFLGNVGSCLDQYCPAYGREFPVAELFDRVATIPLIRGAYRSRPEADVLAEIEARNLVAVRYVDENGENAVDFPANPNGSINSIAGICDTTGRVFGLMPHPEAFLSPYNSPTWTADQLKGELPAEGDGVQIFRNAVEYFA